MKSRWIAPPGTKRRGGGGQPGLESVGRYLDRLRHPSTSCPDPANESNGNVATIIWHGRLPLRRGGQLGLSFCVIHAWSGSLRLDAVVLSLQSSVLRQRL